MSATASTATAGRLRLYEAADALQIVSAWLDEHSDELLANGGALTPELEAVVDQAEGDFAAKVQGVVLMAREYRASAAAAKAEAARLAQRAKVAESAADSLDRYALANMLRARELKVKTPMVSVSAVLSTPSVAVADPAKLVPLGFAAVGEAPPPPIKVDRAKVLATFNETRDAAIETAAALELDVHERNNVECAVRMTAEVEEWLDDAPRYAKAVAEALAERLDLRRSEFVAAELAKALPGVTVTRGHHLRVS